MKNFCITFLVLFIIIATVCFAVTLQTEAAAETEYLRIHVRANSNSESDQRVKYEIKDEIVRYLTPAVAECVTKERAVELMADMLPEIESLCEKALRERGYGYGARAFIRAEQFPTRVYGELTLERGIYDALIVELGSGAGDNWWCVIYPPLCFTSGGAGVKYRSAILDIINKFINR